MVNQVSSAEKKINSQSNQLNSVATQLQSEASVNFLQTQQLGLIGSKVDTAELKIESLAKIQSNLINRMNEILRRLRI